MPLVPQQIALAELDAHLEALATVAVQAWDRYHLLPAADRMIFGARERANCVHAYMVHYAAAYVAVAPGTIRCFKLNQMCGIVIDNKYAIRFKKLDEDSKSRNQPSRQVKEFQSQIELVGIDASHHFDVGYVLNLSETDILDVRLVHPAGEGIAWAKSLAPAFQDESVVDLFEVTESEEVVPAVIEPKEAAVVLKFEKKKDQ